MEIPSLLDEQLQEVISNANDILARFRSATADLALSPFIVSHKADLYTTLTANHNVVDMTGDVPLNRNQAYSLMAEIAGVDAGTGRLEFNDLFSEKGCKLTVLVYRRVRM